MNNQNSIEYDTNLNKPLDIAVEYEDVLSNPIPVESAKLGELLDAKISKSGKIIGLRTDWTTFDISRFSYQADNVLNVTGISVEDYFQVGDKVKITQTTDKYFYIIYVDTDNNRIEIHGGDSDNGYVFTNDAFTNVYISRLSSPQGFPTIFVYIATFTDQDGDPITFGDPGLGVVEFGIDGSSVLFAINFFNLDIGAGTSTINISTPLKLVSMGSIQYTTSFFMNNNGAYIDCFAAYSRDPSDTSVISLTRPGFVDFGTGMTSGVITLNAKL